MLYAKKKANKRIIKSNIGGKMKTKQILSDREKSIIVQQVVKEVLEQLNEDIIQIATEVVDEVLNDKLSEPVPVIIKKDG